MIHRAIPHALAFSANNLNIPFHFLKVIKLNISSFYQYNRCLTGQSLSLVFVPGFLLSALGQNLSLMCLSCPGDRGDAIHKFGLEEHVCIGEHSIF